MSVKELSANPIIVAALAAAATGLITWGGVQSSIQYLKDDVLNIKTWKDAAIEKMGNIDGKLDALLQANGVEYKPRENHR